MTWVDPQIKEQLTFYIQHLKYTKVCASFDIELGLAPVRRVSHGMRRVLWQSSGCVNIRRSQLRNLKGRTVASETLQSSSFPSPDGSCRWQVSLAADLTVTSCRSSSGEVRFFFVYSSSYRLEKPIDVTGERPSLILNHTLSSIITGPYIDTIVRQSCISFRNNSIRQQL